jgi:hypothetical protein
MDANAILTWAGIIITTVGTGVTIWQAWDARQAAKKAKQIRDQLIQHRNVSELARIQTACKKAQKSMDKYGPGFSPERLIGLASNSDGEDVQEFLTLLIEHRAYFGNSNPNTADDFYNTLTRLLNSFVTAQDDATRRRRGILIVTNLGSFAAVIKDRLESSSESVP